MKIAGHTMGTPEYDLDAAVDLFSTLGFDGIEIIWDDSYSCALPKKSSRSRIRELKKRVDDYGITIACLTPYMTEINSLENDILRSDLDDFSRCIEAAGELGCSGIRVYGGRYEHEKEKALRARKEIRLIESLRNLGKEAAAHEVNLVVETHFNTMTDTAAETARIIKKVDHRNVKVLYDQPNLAFIGGEEYQDALKILEHLIGMVHVKDLVFKEDVELKFKSASVTHPVESERIVKSKIPGEGIIPWPGIIKGLKEMGFTGYLSLEYERRWYPQDLPPANEGMKKGLNYIRSIIEGKV